jgi:anti-anti-sigma factor
MKTSKAEDTGALLLTGSLEIYDAEPLRQSLLEYVAAGSELVLDLGSVEACDTAGAQILYSARTTAIQAGKKLRFDHVSPAVASCWERLGLPEKFLNL